MFIGYTIGNIIQKSQDSKLWKIFYRSSNSCLDHMFDHLVSGNGWGVYNTDYVYTDNSINITNYRDISSYYNIVIVNNVEQLRESIQLQIPIACIVYNKDAWVTEIFSLLNSRSKLPVFFFCFNKELSDQINQLRPDTSFFLGDLVPTNIYYDNSIEKTIDLTIMNAGQTTDSITTIKDKLESGIKNIKIDFFGNNYTTEYIREKFSKSKLVLEINTSNIINCLYASECSCLPILIGDNKTLIEKYPQVSLTNNIDNLIQLTANLLDNYYKNIDLLNNHKVITKLDQKHTSIFKELVQYINSKEFLTA